MNKDCLRIVPPVEIHEDLVHFCETDMAGVVHFSNILRYVERAEASLFARAGLLLVSTGDGALSGWPRTRVECRYTSPLRFGDRYRVSITDLVLGEYSLDLHFRIGKIPEETLVAEGVMTTVYVNGETPGGRFRARLIPPAVRDALAGAAVRIVGTVTDNQPK